MISQGYFSATMKDSADLPEAVGPAMPTVVHDLPAHQKRIEQRATGFLATIIGGQIIHDGVHETGARPGQLLRGPLAQRKAG